MNRPGGKSERATVSGLGYSADCSRSDADKADLHKIWIDMLGLKITGDYVSESENVDEDIAVAGSGPAQGRSRSDAADRPRQETEGPRPRAESRRALDRRSRRRRRMAGSETACVSPPAAFAGGPGDSTSVSFIQRATKLTPIGGAGVLIELVQAPREVREAFEKFAE